MFAGKADVLHFSLWKDTIEQFPAQILILHDDGKHQRVVQPIIFMRCIGPVIHSFPHFLIQRASIIFYYNINMVNTPYSQ